MGFVILTYTLPPGTIVRAPADGVVQFVQSQADSRDYEVPVRRSANVSGPISP